MQWLSISEQQAGQRLDNYLLTLLKGVPKTRIYRIIRRGEVRLNGGRCKPSVRLKAGDALRLPPLRLPQPGAPVPVPRQLRTLDQRILYEDADVVVIDKPAGAAVHGGSGLSMGVIEALKQGARAGEYLELAHRLDRDTSGCLLLARSRESLLALHRAFRRESGRMDKHYVALVIGPVAKTLRIDTPLQRVRDARDGRSRVRAGEGQSASSVVRPRIALDGTTLVDIALETGRMHQARVHCAAAGVPIAGDPLYGDREANRALRRLGLNRLFLHAAGLSFRHPRSGRPVTVESPLPGELSAVIEHLSGEEEAGGVAPT